MTHDIIERILSDSKYYLLQKDCSQRSRKRATHKTQSQQRLSPVRQGDPGPLSRKKAHQANLPGSRICDGIASLA